MSTVEQDIYPMPHAYQLVYEFLLAGWPMNKQPWPADIEAMEEEADWKVIQAIPATYAFLTDEYLMNNPNMKSVAQEWANSEWERIHNNHPEYPRPDTRLPLYVQEFIHRFIMEQK